MKKYYVMTKDLQTDTHSDSGRFREGQQVHGEEKGWRPPAENFPLKKLRNKTEYMSPMRCQW